MPTRFKEIFNHNALYYLLENQELFDKKVQDMARSNDPWLCAKKYLAKSDNGVIDVEYRQQPKHGKPFGRFNAMGSVSLQNISRPIRHTIARDHYVDLDMCNAHPVILLWYCTKHDIPCKYLKKYVDDRESHIADIMEYNPTMSRGEVKRVFLSLINGGKGAFNAVQIPTTLLSLFKAETEQILSKVSQLNPDLFKRAKEQKDADMKRKGYHNPKSTCCNWILCNYENDILQIFLKLYRAKGIITNCAVLCFDGIMIPKHEDIEKYIPEAEETILRKTGIPMKLAIKPMDEGFDLPEVLPQYHSYTPFNPKDPFVWMDFDEKWRGHLFNNREAVITETKRDLNRVFARIAIGNGMLVKKLDLGSNLMDITDMRTAFTDLYFEYMEGEKTKQMSFKQYIQKFAQHMNRYNYIDFIPNSTDPRLFNLWRGFKGTEVLNPDYNCIQPILDHIMNIYCQKHVASYNYFLDILSFIVKNPEKPTKKAIFLYSKTHGSGKNIVLDFLKQYVWGDSTTLYTAGIDTVLEKHNSLLKTRKCIIVDEMASRSDSFVGDFNKFKSMLTGDSILINPKGKTQFSIRNTLSWFLISNHSDSVRIEPTDRRWFCLNVSDEKTGDMDYFDEIARCFNKECGDTFYTYLLNRPKAEIRTPPINPFKKSIIQRGLSSSIEYLKFYQKSMFQEIKEASVEKKSDDLMAGYRDFPDKMSPTELFRKYKFWCSENNERSKSRRAFDNDLSSYMDGTKKIDIRKIKFRF